MYIFAQYWTTHFHSKTKKGQQTLKCRKSKSKKNLSLFVESLIQMSAALSCEIYTQSEFDQPNQIREKKVNHTKGKAKKKAFKVMLSKVK